MVILNKNIHISTIFSSLSQQLNMLVLKLHELSDAECLFSVKVLQYFYSLSLTGHISLKAGMRYYATDNESEADID